MREILGLGPLRAVGKVPGGAGEGLRMGTSCLQPHSAHHLTCAQAQLCVEFLLLGWVQPRQTFPISTCSLWAVL